MSDKTEKRAIADRKEKAEAYHRRLDFMALMAVIFSLFFLKIMAFMSAE